MAWEAGARYRGRGVRGEFHVTENKNKTRYVEGFVEVTLGSMQGQRLRYRGYVNTDGNREITAKELRAMGWKGESWRDLGGIGSKEFNFTCLADAGTDEAGKERTYLRAGFVRELETLDRRKALSASDLDDMPPPPPPASAVNGRASRESAPAPSEAGDAADIPF